MNIRMIDMRDNSVLWQGTADEFLNVNERSPEAVQIIADLSGGAHKVTIGGGATPVIRIEREVTLH